MQDLAYALRDGVLLCHTLHMIDPSTLDMKQVLNVHFLNLIVLSFLKSIFTFLDVTLYSLSPFVKTKIFTQKYIIQLFVKHKYSLSLL